jgi:CRP/FNR family transcriptional regulator, anaerobic regulatory protein
MTAVETDNRKDIHNSDLPIICRSCESRHKGVCGALTPDQLLQLSRHTVKSVVEKEQELLAAGGDIERYSNILSGVVKLTKLMADGRQQIVGLQFAPDLLGRPFKRQSDLSAEAATSVRVCSFPKSVLEKIIRQSPEMEHRLYEQTLRELDEARDWMLTLGRKTASEKVASFLYLIARHIDPDIDVSTGAIRFELPLKRADIADFLGLTIETVSRQLTKLRNAGVIMIENNRTIIIDHVDTLARLCETER